MWNHRHPCRITHTVRNVEYCAPTLASGLLILTTLHDEAVNIPISYAGEMAVYNSEKVKDIAFADNPYSLDMTRVALWLYK